MEEEGSAVVQVFSLYMMRRLDKQPDRVEISPEQLSSGAIEAESLSERLNRTVQVVGWYHSHPHITHVQTYNKLLLPYNLILGLIIAQKFKSESAQTFYTV